MSLPPPSGPPDTSDKNTLRRAEISAIFQQSTPNGDRQINGIKLPNISGNRLNISGDVYLRGLIKTPLNLTSGIRFPDGSPISPSITFVNDPDTGFYRDGSGSIGISSNGTPIVVAGSDLSLRVPISTTGGANLSLNPSGPSVDFNGKTLINVGGFSTDPNRYEEVGPETITLGAVPLSALVISTISNASYAITADIACSHSDGMSSGGYTLFTKAKNIGGVVTIVTPYISLERNTDPILASTNVEFVSSGPNINVVVTGTAASVKWRAAAVITRQLF